MLVLHFLWQMFRRGYRLTAAYFVRGYIRFSEGGRFGGPFSVFLSVYGDVRENGSISESFAVCSHVIEENFIYRLTFLEIVVI